MGITYCGEIHFGVIVLPATALMATLTGDTKSIIGIVSPRRANISSARDWSKGSSMQDLEDQ